jgi:hypothetical protein
VRQLFRDISGSQRLSSGNLTCGLSRGPRYHAPKVETRTHIAHDLPHGFTDDKDVNAAWVREANETLSATESTPVHQILKPRGLGHRDAQLDGQKR